MDIDIYIYIYLNITIYIYTRPKEGAVNYALTIRHHWLHGAPPLSVCRKVLRKS